MHPKWTPCAAWLIGLFGLLAEGPAHAGPPDNRDKNGVEVLTRGPVHEAYALPADQQTAPGPLVPRQPPADVEELPPDQKPDGADVQWLPGYWSWDDERRDFVWVSGFWRVPPPDRAWVPGGWRQGRGGWQWVSGFWNPVGDPARPEARIEFLPEPPAPIEAGPTIPAPANDSVYVPGTWVYRERYLWRSGYWADYRPGWVWAPACYRWTPSGHVFIDGYWDRSLEDRGVLFPPVAISQEVYAAPGFAGGLTTLVTTSDTTTRVPGSLPGVVAISMSASGPPEGFVTHCSAITERLTSPTRTGAEAELAGCMPTVIAEKAPGRRAR